MTEIISDNNIEPINQNEGDSPLPLTRRSPLIFMLNNLENMTNNVNSSAYISPLFPYYNIIFKILSKYEKQSAIKSPINENDICPIDQEKIEYGEYYYKCNLCQNHNFREKNFKQLFYHDIENDTSFKIKSVKCPICRNNIIFLPQLYINRHKNIFKHFLQKYVLS
jgi:hypothetical protein